MFIKVLSVSSLNNYIKKVIDNDFILNNANVKGELSNVKIHTSGHIYFSLKDSLGKINCVMFRDNALRLNFIPKNGMNVVIKGRVSVYEKEGVYQLYCDEMQVEGEGELYIAFQKLKEKLEKEGLFDVSRKKHIPCYPRRIGVITSPTGAAIRDIINVSTRRNKNIDMIIYPALVQGINAGENIIKGIEYLNTIADVDVIILARGGGSIEELWAFNEEALAYSIYKSNKPIITGIGHETDFTIADFVSDVRAATPSAAAELVVSSLEQINNMILNYAVTLNKAIENKINNERNRVHILEKTLNLNNPINHIVNQYGYLDKIKDALNYNMKFKISEEKQKLMRINALLQAHNPLNVLNKGYAVIEHDDKVIGELHKLKKVEDIKITLKDGSGRFKVKYMEES